MTSIVRLLLLRNAGFLLKKHRNDIVRDEKYIIIEYFDYKTEKEKSFHEQAHEVQNLLAIIVPKETLIDERLPVAHLSFENFKVSLKYRRVALNINDTMYSI